MRIALINPPSPFLLDQRVFPNLSLLYLATQMRKDGIEADIIDLMGNAQPERAVWGISGDYDWYGFTSTSAQFSITHKLLRALKAANPGAKTAIGGAHANAMASLKMEGKEDVNFKAIEEFDRIIAGDGETGYRMLERRGKWQLSELVKDIDTIPIPDRGLIDIKSYNYRVGGRKATTLMTQRGCPYRCAFCSGRKIPAYNKARQHSPERVLREMDELHDRFGFEGFMWFDDEININPERLERLAEMLKGRNYKHRGFLRSDLAITHPEILEKLADAGFAELCFGVESGSDRTLRRVGKGTRSKDAIELARRIRSLGMRLKIFTMIGLPGETYEDVLKTKDIIVETNPDEYDVTILTPYPGSRIYNEAIPSTKYEGYAWEWNGLYFNKPEYSKEPVFYKGIPGQHDSLVRTDELNARNIIELRGWLAGRR